MDKDGLSKGETKDQRIAIIAEEDLVVGFLLGGIGEFLNPRPGRSENKMFNYFVYETRHVDMEKMHRDLKAFYWRIVSQPEIGIVLVSPEVNQLLIHELEERRRLGNIIPVFVEIPGKYSPYSIDNDPIMLLAAEYL